MQFIPAIKKVKKDLIKEGFKVWELHGKIKVIERKPILDQIELYNAKNKEKGILLVSQVGNEGLDFDKFSDTIIHFDGHYNPAVISQRNGRVYRGDNKAKDIKIYYLVLKETYDQRIKFIEEEKRKLKDFYLGDSELELLFEKIVELDINEKKNKLNKLLKFKIDFRTKKEISFTTNY